MKPAEIDGEAPRGWEKVVYAKDQPEYIPLPALRSVDGRVVSRWILTEDERRLVAAGADIYLSVHTFNGPLQPVLLTVDGAEHEP